MIYKVSYVVQSGEYPGSIKNEEEEPKIGARVMIGPIECKVVETHQIMPPRGDFTFLHATVVPVEQLATEEE
jgi:hypothetical protein